MSLPIQFRKFCVPLMGLVALAMGTSLSASADTLICRPAGVNPAPDPFQSSPSVSANGLGGVVSAPPGCTLLTTHKNACLKDAKGHPLIDANGNPYQEYSCSTPLPRYPSSSTSSNSPTPTPPKTAATASQDSSGGGTSDNMSKKGPQASFDPSTQGPNMSVRPPSNPQDHDGQVEAEDRAPAGTTVGADGIARPNSPGGTSPGGAPGTPTGGGGSTSQTAANAPRTPDNEAGGGGDANPYQPTLEREGDAYHARENAGHNTDECKISTNINSKYSCDGTRATIDGAKISNAVSQTAGSIITASTGNSQQQAAMSAGTQSAALQAAAVTQRTSGDIQVGTGAVNAALGVWQLYLSTSHKSDGKSIAAGSQDKLESTKTDANNAKNANRRIIQGDDTSDYNGHVTGADSSVAGQIVDKFNMNEQSQIVLHEVNPALHTEAAAMAAADAFAKANPNNPKAQRDASENHRKEIIFQNMVVRRKFDEDARQKDITKHTRNTGAIANDEQAKMAKEAMGGGMMSLITGIGQGVQGAFNIAGANQLEDAANKLKAMEALSNPSGFQALGPASVGPGDALAPRDGTTLTGTGTLGDSQAAQDDPIKDDGLGGAGRPIGAPPSNALNNAGPPPGKFTAKDGAAPGGGGGGAGLGGGGSTSAATGDNSEPQARMADTKSPGYDGGGGGFAGMGGAGAGGAKDPDLSGMLAQFLPTKEDEAKKSGILNFGGREPASEGPISLLDKNANIFDRIHETYQDKNRRGKIGI